MCSGFSISQGKPFHMSRLLSRFPIQPLVLVTWSLLVVLTINLIQPLSLLDPLLAAMPYSPGQQLLILLLLLAPLGLLLTFKSTRLQRALETQQQQHKQEIKSLKQSYNKTDNQIRTLMQSDQIAYWEWDIKNNRADYSPQWKKMLGYPADETLNSLHALQNRIHPKDQPAVQTRFLKILSGEHRHFECTHRVQHQDGHYLWVHDKGQIFYSPYGEVEKLSAIRLDVSAQKWIEAELELDATIIEHSSEGIAIADENRQVIRCNRALSEALKLTREEIENMDLQTLIEALQSNPSSDTLEKVESEGRWRGEMALFDSGGQLLLASIVHIQKIFQETSQSVHYSLTLTDITDLKHSQQALDDLANIDNVTGLANRNRLYQELDRVLQDEQPITLFFMDLDDFKPVNDTFGHDLGDTLLKKVSRVIQDSTPDNTLISRIGGDEFVLFYPQPEDPEQAKQIAQTLSDRLKQPFQIENQSIRIGSSIGIAHYPQDAQQRQSLMKAADTAMYQAKRAGKGRFHCFSAQT